mgnify:CR=1 FL=1
MPNYNDAIEEIKSRCNIVDVISSVVPLKRAGTNYKGICPFHNEKTPSFVVYPETQSFYCFGCHVGGNIFDFVKEYEGVDFAEACKRIVDRFGIVGAEQDKKNAKTQHLHKSQVMLMREKINSTLASVYKYCTKFLQCTTDEKAIAELTKEAK